MSAQPLNFDSPAIVGQASSLSAIPSLSVSGQPLRFPYVFGQSSFESSTPSLSVSINITLVEPPQSPDRPELVTAHIPFDVTTLTPFEETTLQHCAFNVAPATIVKNSTTRFFFII